MNVGGRGRDEDVVRALRAASERRRQARRQRRARIVRIVRVGLCVAVPVLGLATVVGTRSTCKRPPPVAQQPVRTPPLVAPMPAPPVCPHDDGLEDDDRVGAITSAFEAIPASARRTPIACWRSRSCDLPRDAMGDFVDIKDQYARCFQAAPSAYGAITVKAAVARDGRVRTRVVAPPEARAVGRCLAAAVGSVGFPPSSGFATEMPFRKWADAEPPGCPETVTARRLRLLDEAMDAVSRTCGAPNAVDVCSAGAFARTFGERLAIIEQNRQTAERRWLQAVESDHDSAAFGLAWLRSRKALPLLRKRLVDDFIEPGDFYDAHPSPEHRMMLTTALEHISGRPLRQVVQLTAAQRRTLRDISRVRMTDACHLPPERTNARWLLHELDGVPLGNPAWKIPANVRCRAGSAVAIWH